MELLIEFGYVVLFELYCTCIFVIILAFYMRYSCIIQVIEFGYVVLFASAFPLGSTMHMQCVYNACIMHAMHVLYI